MFQEPSLDHAHRRARRVEPRPPHDPPGTLAEGRDPRRLALFTPIREAMSRGFALEIRADFSVETVASIFIENDIAAAPVVDGTGRLVGIVTMGDLLREYWDDVEIAGDGPKPQDEDPRGAEPGFHSTRLARATAGEVMQPVGIAIPSNAPLLHAAALLASGSVGQIPVTTETGMVMGVLTALDVVRWLARTEGADVPAHGGRAEADRRLAEIASMR